MGEMILPYLFAAMETCWIDAVFIGLASLDFFQSHNPLMPLWAPFLLIIGSQWLLGYLERRNAVSGDSTDSDRRRGEGWHHHHRFAWLRAFRALCDGNDALCDLGFRVSATAFVLDPRWLLALVNDILLLDGNAYHVFCIVAIALYLCWRGLRLLTRTYEPSQIFNTLRIGMGVIIAVILLRAGQESAGVVLNDDLTLLLLVPIFLFLSLAAHALARVTFVRHTHPVGLDGDASTQERFILTIIGVIGGALLLLSWLVDTFASASILAETRQILTLVGAGYDAFVQVLATIIVFLATPLFWLFKWWAARFPPNLPKVPKTGPPHQPPRGVFHAAPTTPLLVPSLKILVPIVLIILAVIVIRWILRRKRRVQLTARRQREEVRESLWSWSLFWTQIKALLYALFGRFFPRKAIDEHVLTESEELPIEPAARSIREMYRLLLQRAATHGYPRKKDETPNEFKQRLHDHIPTAEPQLATVTHAYTATRYGGIVPDEAEVAHVRQEWNTLEQKWRTPPPG